jgi:hypothetical protein
MTASDITSLLVLGAAVAVIIEATKRFASGVSRSIWWVRALPFLPLLLGALGAAVVPGRIPGEGYGEKILYGILAGAFSGQSYGVVVRQFTAATKTKESSNE